MMKSKIILTACLALVLAACDSNEPASPQVMPKQTTEVPVEMEKPTPVTQAETPVAEPVPAQETPVSEPQPGPVVAANEPMSGEAVYKKTCMACHASGAANAPKLGDKAAWQPRIEKGMDALMQSALNGIPGTAMMKRGNCNACSDAELKAAVEYMVAQSR